MTTPLRTLTAEPNTNAIRTETWRERDYLVAPVVILVEGVYQCATCPTAELYLASEFGKIPDSWNGRPITIGHPQVDGIFVSANSREVLDTFEVGQVFNTTLDGAKLKAELWIDLTRVEEVGELAQAAVTAIETGDPLEISSGYFATVTNDAGMFNGRKYEAVQHEVTPDHVALLPGQVGACSWADGCGTPRVNRADMTAFLEDMRRAGRAAQAALNQRQEEVHVTTQPAGDEQRPGLRQRLQRIWDAMLRGNAEGPSDREVRDALYSALDELNLWDAWITDVFPEDQTFIYEREGDLYERSYVLQDDGRAEIGDATQVMREVTYVPITDDGEPTPNAKPSAPPPDPKPQAQPCGCKKGTTVNTKERVDALIANGPYTEEDRKALEGLPLTTLAKLAPNEPPEPIEEPEEPTAAEPAVELEPTTNAKPVSIDAAFAKLEELAGPDVTNTIRAQHARAMKHRQELVEAITANKAAGFTPDDLKAMTDEQLEKLAKLSAPVDYSGARPPKTQSSASDEDAAPAPPPVVLAKPTRTTASEGN